MAIKTKPFDAAKYFTKEEDQFELLQDALNEGHAGYVAAALGTIARARGGISALAAQTGLNRQALHKALSGEGNPNLTTLLAIVKALHLRLAIAPEDAKEPA